jgi:hypothetical protein
MLNRPQGHNAADLILNRARDFSACSIMPQPTTLPRVERERERERENENKYTEEKYVPVCVC